MKSDRESRIFRQDARDLGKRTVKRNRNSSFLIRWKSSGEDFLYILYRLFISYFISKVLTEEVRMHFVAHHCLNGGFEIQSVLVIVAAVAAGGIWPLLSLSLLWELGQNTCCL